MRKADDEIDEVEEDGTPYSETCVHGVHFGGYRCIVCHPEKQAAMLWLFLPLGENEQLRKSAGG